VNIANWVLAVVAGAFIVCVAMILVDLARDLWR
jgi:hypothetical protein